MLTLPQTRLRELASLGGDGVQVISVYLDLDPSEFGVQRARTSQIESLLDTALRQTPGYDIHAPLEKADPAVQAIERLRRYLEAEFDPARARSAAVFITTDRMEPQVFRLEIHVDPTAMVGRRPLMRPLLRDPPPLLDCCVFMVSRKRARAFLDRGLGLREAFGLEDDVPNRHHQGGFSQPRYQRHIEQHVLDHVKHACEQLRSLHQRTGFERLIVGGEEEVVPLIDQHLAPELKKLVIGSLEKDYESFDDATLTAAAAEVARADQLRRDQALLDKLVEELGQEDRAVSGMGDVLTVINDQRIDTLFISPRLEASGSRGANGDWLGEWPGPSPLDGTELEPEPDLVEAMISRTFRLSGTVRVLDAPALEELTGVAALLRY